MHEQGVLVGDLNEVQQLALVVVLGKAQETSFEDKWRDFVMSAIAAHPENGRKLIKLLGMTDSGDEGEFARELSDEEMAEYVPVQESGDLPAVLADLQRLGFAVRDD